MKDWMAEAKTLKRWRDNARENLLREDEDQ
jgi:hypothetical protein